MRPIALNVISICESCASSMFIELPLYRNRGMLKTNQNDPLTIIGFELKPFTWVNDFRTPVVKDHTGNLRERIRRCFSCSLEGALHA